MSDGKGFRCNTGLEDYYYDEEQKVFPWLDSWFAKDLMHGYVKNVIIKSGYLLLLVVIWDFLRPWQRITPFVRSRLRFVAAASPTVTGWDFSALGSSSP